MNPSTVSREGIRKLTATVEQAQYATGLGRTKLYALMSEGTLRSIKVGRRRLICIDSLEAFARGEAA